MGRVIGIIVTNRCGIGADAEDSLHLLAVGLEHLVEAVAAGPSPHLGAGLAAGVMVLESRSPRTWCPGFYRVTQDTGHLEILAKS